MIWADLLWGKQAKFIHLLMAALFLLFFQLDGREMWTQEHRWAEIVERMRLSHDYFHPILYGNEYYDKPLLSYWLMAGLSFLTGKLNLWALRLPSALAGLLAIWSIYRIGFLLKDKQLGLLSGWLLLTTYYFVFWSHNANAEMLNMAGSLFAVAWYFEKRNSGTFFDYTIFFLILAVSGLCKGLVGPIVAILAILPDVFLQKSAYRHLNSRMLAGLIPGLFIYFLPFLVSAYVGGESYHQFGLELVYRENILRYFKPFDHTGPIYTYFISLPVYLLPWAFFFIPALFYLKSRWEDMPLHAKWSVFAVLLLFLFFTLSGSRRNYYILPMVPFAILMTADWILSDSIKQRYLWAGRVAVMTFIGLSLVFSLLLPLYYSLCGVQLFEARLKDAAVTIKPWSSWQFMLLDAEFKMIYYLHLSPDTKNYPTKKAREKQTHDTLLSTWPILTTQPADTIIVTRQLHEPLLRDILRNYTVVALKPTYIEMFLKQKDPNLPIAFIPKK